MDNILFAPSLHTDQPPQLQRRHSQREPTVSYTPNGRLPNDPNRNDESPNKEEQFAAADLNQSSDSNQNQPGVEDQQLNQPDQPEAYASDSPSIRYIDSQSQSSGSPAVSKTSESKDQSLESGRAPSLNPLCRITRTNRP